MERPENGTETETGNGNARRQRHKIMDVYDKYLYCIVCKLIMDNLFEVNVLL